MAVLTRAAVVGLCVALLGCAGPTASDAAMRSQAEQSAGDMVSELRTALLVTGTQLEDRAWWHYTDVLVTDAENSAGAIEETFTSRQPPSRDVDALYQDSSTMLGDAAELLTHLRIAVRRHDRSEIRSVRAQVSAAADALQRLESSLR